LNGFRRTNDVRKNTPQKNTPCQKDYIKPNVAVPSTREVFVSLRRCLRGTSGDQETSILGTATGPTPIASPQTTAHRAIKSEENIKKEEEEER